MSSTPATLLQPKMISQSNNLPHYLSRKCLPPSPPSSDSLSPSSASTRSKSQRTSPSSLSTGSPPQSHTTPNSRPPSSACCSPHTTRCPHHLCGQSTRSTTCSHPPSTRCSSLPPKSFLPNPSLRSCKRSPQSTLTGPSPRSSHNSLTTRPLVTLPFKHSRFLHRLVVRHHRRRWRATCRRPLPNGCLTWPSTRSEHTMPPQPSTRSNSTRAPPKLCASCPLQHSPPTRARLDALARTPPHCTLQILATFTLAHRQARSTFNACASSRKETRPTVRSVLDASGPRASDWWLALHLDFWTSLVAARAVADWADVLARALEAGGAPPSQVAVRKLLKRGSPVWVLRISMRAWRARPLSRCWMRWIVSWWLYSHMLAKIMTMREHDESERVGGVVVDHFKIWVVGERCLGQGWRASAAAAYCARLVRCVVAAGSPNSARAPSSPPAPPSSVCAWLAAEFVRVLLCAFQDADSDGPAWACMH
ncbi:hypothetical protein BCR44DRAFT_1219910 [Catenaria anguillulae PL171]|uniref:Rhodanese domain-containing protein n=1 Tax=Catenaria anguillulae PL171 TaxID=765915 RepID=A0A1Y2HZG7_9FUNG|nr:hypothetical protein BCR44DRAFT_1219910 [Catenaria anguillulae PL171]